MNDTDLPKRTSLRAAVALLAALAATPAGFSQSRFGADGDRQQEIVERIALEEARSGPYSEGLFAPLSDLALLYQDRGDHDLAIAVIDRVRQIVRANKGLHSLEQIPLLQQMIANEEAIGRVETAWELEQDLLTLARRHPGDIRTAPVFRETAAKRMALLNQYLAGEFPPQMVLGCYYGWPRLPRRVTEGTVTNGTFAKEGDCNSGIRDEAIRALVSDAQTNYAHAIAVMQRNELYSSDELRELELELLRSIEVIRGMRGPRRNNAQDLVGAGFDAEPWRSWVDAMGRIAPQPVAGPGVEHEEPQRGVDYRLGRQSLERLLAYEIARSSPLPDQVEAFVPLADWDLLDARNSLALEQYEQAYDMLQDAGAQTSIDELFSPKIPVVLPTFEPNPLASDSTDRSTGYIDVAFEISRYGEGRSVRILDTTTNAKAADKTRLVQLIQRSRFRPRITDGQFARASPVVLRYFLAD